MLLHFGCMIGGVESKRSTNREDMIFCKLANQLSKLISVEVEVTKTRELVPA